jgi:hypothetical protein
MSKENLLSDSIVILRVEKKKNGANQVVESERIVVCADWVLLILLIKELVIGCMIPALRIAIESFV